MRLRRSDLSAPGLGRRRRGRSFSYTGTGGRPITDPETLARIRELVIPPAWTDVWISPDPRGHIQAAGTDAAGRRQYLYHDAWRRKRDREKFDHVLEVAARLPRLRRRLAADLRGDRLTADRVLAAAAKLVDLGLFRVGSDEYAKGDDATYGVTTLLPEHLRIRRTGMEFRYPAKGGVERVCSIVDDDVCRVLTQLRRRRGSRLFRYRAGREWRELRSDDLNGYLKAASGIDMTAKDFRTWHATVLAATLLAGHDPTGTSLTRRRRTVARVMREVAEELGNTPAVAKASYVDPRIVDLYHDGVTVPLPTRFTRPALESAVLRLLRDA
ncbi:MAG: DNA topoisomerase IB [Actinobacteria bacterium]|nr:MAG: DNA topoisomerase IB [Actinomycetota bacterium]